MAPASYKDDERARLSRFKAAAQRERRMLARVVECGQVWSLATECRQTRSSTKRFKSVQVCSLPWHGDRISFHIPGMISWLHQKKSSTDGQENGFQVKPA